MKGPREARKIMNIYRSRAAKAPPRWRKKNGGTGWLDDLHLERLVYNSKRRYERHLQAHVW